MVDSLWEIFVVQGNRDMIYATQEELDEAVAYWQPRMRLADWTLRVELVSAGQSKDLNVSGHCTFCDNKMSATIQIIKAEDLRDHLSDRNVAATNHELTLVHEMLHCHYGLIEPSRDDETKWALFERCIDQVAKVIVDLNRAAVPLRIETSA